MIITSPKCSPVQSPGFAITIFHYYSTPSAKYGTFMVSVYLRVSSGPRLLLLLEIHSVAKCEIATVPELPYPVRCRFLLVQMASKSSLNIHSTYHESFLALSVGIRVNKHQLKMENQRNQAPVLRYRDITVTSEALKGCLAAECPVLGVHNVARMRTGTLPLFEVDFIEKKAFERFCRSLQGEV